MTSAAKGLKLGDNSFLTFQPIEVKFLHVDSGAILQNIVLCVTLEYWKSRFLVNVNIEVLEIGDCGGLQW